MISKSVEKMRALIKRNPPKASQKHHATYKKDETVVECFPAFRHYELSEDDKVILRELVQELGMAGVLGSYHEDEQWTDSEVDEEVLGRIIEDMVSQDDEFSNDPSPAKTSLKGLEILGIAPEGYKEESWSASFMDDYESEDDLIAELHAREKE